MIPLNYSLYARSLANRLDGFGTKNDRDNKISQREFNLFWYYNHGKTNNTSIQDFYKTVYKPEIKVVTDTRNINGRKAITYKKVSEAKKSVTKIEFISGIERYLSGLIKSGSQIKESVDKIIKKTFWVIDRKNIINNSFTFNRMRHKILFSKSILTSYEISLLKDRNNFNVLLELLREKTSPDEAYVLTIQAMLGFSGQNLDGRIGSWTISNLADFGLSNRGNREIGINLLKDCLLLVNSYVRSKQRNIVMKMIFQALIGRSSFQISKKLTKKGWQQVKDEAIKKFGLQSKLNRFRTKNKKQIRGKYHLELLFSLNQESLPTPNDLYDVGEILYWKARFLNPEDHFFEALTHGFRHMIKKGHVYVINKMKSDIEKEYKVPITKDMPFVGLHESFWNNKACSGDDACGYWQITAPTARLLGLEVNDRDSLSNSTKAIMELYAKNYKLIYGWGAELPPDYDPVHKSAYTIIMNNISPRKVKPHYVNLHGAIEGYSRLQESEQNATFLNKILAVREALRIYMMSHEFRQFFSELN